MLKVDHIDDAKAEGMIAAPLEWKGVRLGRDFAGTIDDLSAITARTRCRIGISGSAGPPSTLAMTVIGASGSVAPARGLGPAAGRYRLRFVSKQ